MCGIAGWLGRVPKGDEFAERMVRSMHHRGPDGHGMKSWAEATLVHTRLSIIDLTPTGAQPMANEDGTIWTVFNGEIYNHRELRHDLELDGHVFRGRSDTEVLPHLYEQYGTDFVSRLRGMFALAIYDSRNRRLILARDRFGIKPLFYSLGKERLAFGSEIAVLLQLPGIDDHPDKQAISDFAALCYIPAPETFYHGIRALQPAEMLEARFERDTVSWGTRIYHRWIIRPDKALTSSQAADRADELLTAAVQKQTESDVPLGALLSGGIDSSLISIAAQDAMQGKLRTFNVRFTDKEYDETWAALAVANHIRSRHETLDMEGTRGTWDIVTSLLLHGGQPFADSSIFAVNAICRLMRQHVTVAISGDGGDEAFGGYDVYWQLARIVAWQGLPKLLRNVTTLAAIPLSGIHLFSRHLPQRMRELSNVDDTFVVQSLFSLLGERDHNAMCRNDQSLPVRRLFERQWESYLPARTSRLEHISTHATEINTRLTLANDFLFKVDAASMRESLEIRVPMLDEDLFAFGLSLPHWYKVNGRSCKTVLRHVAERKLPHVVAGKPKKGFGVPVDAWVDEEFKQRLRCVLLGRSSRLPEFFYPEVYGPLVTAFCGGHSYFGVSRAFLYQVVMMLLSVQLALDKTAPAMNTQGDTR